MCLEDSKEAGGLEWSQDLGAGKHGFADELREGGRAWTKQVLTARVRRYIGFSSWRDGELLCGE